MKAIIYCLLLLIATTVLPITNASAQSIQPNNATGGVSATISSPKAPDCPTCAAKLPENVGCKQGYGNSANCARTFEAAAKEEKTGKTQDTSK